MFKMSNKNLKVLSIIILCMTTYPVVYFLVSAEDRNFPIVISCFLVQISQIISIV